MIGKNPNRCASLINKGGENYQIHLKVPTKTHASKSDYHNKSITIFYGSNC